LARHFVRKIFAAKPWWGVPAVVPGSGIAARRVQRALQYGSLGVKVSGVFSEEEIFFWAHDLPPVLGRLASAPQVAGSRLAHYAIVAMPDKSNAEPRRAIQEYYRGFAAYC
jgi:hypothetical protein